MDRVYYSDGPEDVPNKHIAVDDTQYNEPASLHITEEWDTIMEDFLDDFDDYQDVNFPSSDDDI